MEEAYIIKGYRTAVGKAPRGFFRFKRPDELAAETIEYMISQIPDFDKKLIDDLIVGNAMPEAEQGFNVARLISLLGVVTPSFLWAIILMLIFAFWFPILPVSERMNEALDPPTLVTGLLLVDSLLEGNFKVFSDAFLHLILPGLAIALPAIGNVARLTRTNLSDVYEKQYIEFAKSYSFSEYRIATKYALKPASIPTVTIIGLDFAFMLGNAFLVETVFVWPGMAKYGVEVILAKDLNGIIATALVITTFFLIINMIVDFVVLLLNPRITTKDWYEFF